MYYHHCLPFAWLCKFTLPLKATCISVTKFSQLTGSGYFSRIAVRCHIQKCSNFVPGDPLARCIQSRITASKISSSPEILLSTERGKPQWKWFYLAVRRGCRAQHVPLSGPPGICVPEGGGGRGGLGLSNASLYLPHIQTRDYLTRGGSDARRYSMALPASTDLIFRFVCSPARIRRLS